VKFSRNVFEPLRSAQNAEPGTNATFLAMASISAVPESSGSGSVTHTKKPPAGVVHVTVVGNDTAIASSIAPRINRAQSAKRRGHGTGGSIGSPMAERRTVIGPLVSEQGSADNNGIEWLDFSDMGVSAWPCCGVEQTAYPSEMYVPLNPLCYPLVEARR
jgi:hypothetical protein